MPTKTFATSSGLTETKANTLYVKKVGDTMSGALDLSRSTATGTVYGFQSTLTGASTSNIAFYASASGSTTNLALYAPAGGLWLNGNDGATPTSGSGRRFMWIPGRNAFRVGQVSGTQWDNGNIGTASIAMGTDTRATASNSIAIGTNARASGARSIALGGGFFSDFTAAGDNSVALGASGGSANGDASIVIGTLTRAEFSYAITIGSGNTSAGTQLTNSLASTLMIGFGTNPTLTIQGEMTATGVRNLLKVTGLTSTSLSAGNESSQVLFDFAAATQTHATGALTNQRAFKITRPTYAFVGASTITNAATLYIENSPAAGTNATITNPYSLWIDAGLPRIDSTTANGTVATVLGSLGPTGSNTTVQEWLTVDINGTTRYIPCF